MLSRNTLLVNLRFLDSALSQFEFVPYDGAPLATEGKHLCYNSIEVLKRYKSEKEVSVRDYLHLVMHCVFRHMFMNPTIDRPCWDLACDIAVEYSISELGLKSATAKREALQQKVFSELKQEIKILTAEKIYRYYLDKGLSSLDMAQLRGCFYADNHFLWYETEDVIASVTGESQNENPGDNSGNEASGQSLSEIWKDISEKMQTDLETFSKQQGDKAGGLMQNLNAVNREKYDYTAFLKKFAVLGEAMKINDDEFDYIFYTYGLKMYEKMPLIEPLEYKEVRRIKEFVIAIDTSGSVEGELVQTFVQKTYNILKSTESFFIKINLHIIQCDAEIQEHIKITTQDEFDTYLKTMKIRGLGGTDFRPVFEFTQKLIDEKEFTNLKGLIYFTDGYGTFPAQKPDFDSAFVFVDDEYNNPDVPPWAIKLVLQKDEI
ncbi:MAG: metallopeptidase [Clostridia bacterium]|nr:metallopeptidase [Clostridia bacterium]